MPTFFYRHRVNDTRARLSTVCCELFAACCTLLAARWQLQPVLFDVACLLSATAAAEVAASVFVAAPLILKIIEKTWILMHRIQNELSVQYFLLRCIKSSSLQQPTFRIGARPLQAVTTKEKDSRFRRRQKGEKRSPAKVSRRKNYLLFSLDSKKCMRNRQKLAGQQISRR